MVSLKGRDLLTLKDYTKEEIMYLLDLSEEMKMKKKQHLPSGYDFSGYNIALIFEKSSTRTRCSFEVAAHDLGIGVTYLDPTSSQMGKKETIQDTARVLGRMYEGIEYRGFEQSIVESIADSVDVPVWNGLTNEYHPTQILADFLTIREHRGSLEGAKLVYLGDARYNMGNSLMIGCAKMGMHFVACSAAQNYFPDERLVAYAEEEASESGGSVTLTTDLDVVVGADVIYTDVWVSMGEPDEVWKWRIRDLVPYRVTQELMEKAGPQAIFMHCLPSFHNKDTGLGRHICEKFGLETMEVTDEVFEGPQSVVFDEAENRMHTIKAVIAATLE